MNLNNLKLKELLQIAKLQCNYQRPRNVEMKDLDDNELFDEALAITLHNEVQVEALIRSADVISPMKLLCKAHLRRYIAKYIQTNQSYQRNDR